MTHHSHKLEVKYSHSDPSLRAPPAQATSPGLILENEPRTGYPVARAPEGQVSARDQGGARHQDHFLPQTKWECLGQDRGAASPAPLLLLSCRAPPGTPPPSAAPLPHHCPGPSTASGPRSLIPPPQTLVRLLGTAHSELEAPQTWAEEVRMLGT